MTDMKKQSNIHPLFEQICDIIRPPSEMEKLNETIPNMIKLRKKLKNVETTRIKAEKKMNKLKKIDIEIKERKKLV